MCTVQSGLVRTRKRHDDEFSRGMRRTRKQKVRHFLEGFRLLSTAETRDRSTGASELDTTTLRESGLCSRRVRSSISYAVLVGVRGGPGAAGEMPELDLTFCVNKLLLGWTSTPMGEERGINPCSDIMWISNGPQSLYQL